MANRDLRADDVLSTVANNLRNKSEIIKTADTVDRNIVTEELNGDSHCNMIRRNSLLDVEDAEFAPSIDSNNNEFLNLRGNAACTTADSTATVTVLNLLFLIMPILAHAYDLTNDVYLGIEYFTNEQTVHGWLTFALIIIPAITNTWISSRMHEKDEQEVRAPVRNENQNVLANAPELKPNFVIIILLQLTLPLRYCRSLWYALEVRKCEKEGDQNGLNYYYPKMLKEQEDLALLNVIESFLESAPQLTLQLALLLNQDREITTTMWFKIFGGCVSLFFLGWSMRTYHCAIRSAQRNLAEVNIHGQAMLLIWHIFTIAARIFILGIAASNWPWYTLLATALIWIGWVIWLYVDNGVFEFCRDGAPLSLRSNMERIRTVVFAGVLSVVYIFTFVNVKEGPTCLRYLVYHALYGLQNGIAVALWFTFIYQTIDHVSFEAILVILSVILFIIGIVGMILYYTRLHPTAQKRSYMSVVAHYLSCVRCK